MCGSEDGGVVLLLLVVVVMSLCRRCRSFTIADVGFSLSVVSRNHCAMQPGNQAAETAGSRLGARTKEENEVRSRWTMKVG